MYTYDPFILREKVIGNQLRSCACFSWPHLAIYYVMFSLMNRYYSTFIENKLDLLGSEAEVGPSRAKGIDTVEQPIQSQQSQSVLNEKEPLQQGTQRSSSSNISPFFLLSLLLTTAAIYL